MINGLNASPYSNNSAYHSVLNAQDTQKNSTPTPQEDQERKTYETTLLKRMDDKAYDAFVNSTQSMDDDQKKEMAQRLERAVVVSDANAYAREKEIKSTTQLSMVYNFFESYGDVVSSDQIKDLLNKRLVDGSDVSPEDAQFMQDYLAQLGQRGRLDLRV